MQWININWSFTSTCYFKHRNFINDVWDYIKGDAPVFNYAFSAGDDASDVIAHRLDADLIENAFASHGPMFAFMAASFVLNAQNAGTQLDSNIMKQIEDIADYLNQFTLITPEPNTPEI